MNPIAYLSIHFLNQAPSDINDELYINGTYTDPFVGEDVDSFLVLNVTGNFVFNLSWFITEDGVTTNYQDNLYCPAFDTTYYEILYY